MKKAEICYRCGQDSRVDFMGLPYCGICVFIVEAMIGSVRHDPPPGFPGAPAGATGWTQRMMERLGSQFEDTLEQITEEKKP